MSTNNILVEELRMLGEELRNEFSIHHLQKLAYQTGTIQRKFQAQDLVSLCVFLGQTISSESLASLCMKPQELVSQSKRLISVGMHELRYSLKSYLCMPSGKKVVLPHHYPVALHKSVF